MKEIIHTDTQGEPFALVKAWWFWAAMSVLVVFSVFAGFSSGRSAEASTEAPTLSTATAPAPLSLRATEGMLAQLTPEQLVQYQECARNVSKLIQEGLVQRIDEENRRLYVNDPVWRISTTERKTHVARVVTEYLDWVTTVHPGKLDIRSFRNGKRLAFFG